MIFVTLRVAIVLNPSSIMKTVRQKKKIENLAIFGQIRFGQFDLFDKFVMESNLLKIQKFLICINALIMDLRFRMLKVQRIIQTMLLL